VKGVCIGEMKFIKKKKCYKKCICSYCNNCRTLKKIQCKDFNDQADLSGE
jgi:hypothetical protein